ncbi:MAG: Cna B-type domain-containing protein, partial [Ruminococcus sp.]
MTDNSVVMTITFNTSSEQKDWGNAKFVGTLTNGTEYTQKTDSYLPPGCNKSTYTDANNIIHYNISFNTEVATISLTVSDIRQILNVSNFSEIESFGISYWNSTTISNVSFTNIDPQTPPSSEENTENESTGTISGTVTNGVVELTVTNSKAGEKTNIKVVKSWSGDTDFTSERPESITVQLYQATKADLSYGTKYGESVTLNSANNWTKEWKNIPRIVDDTESNEYLYYVQEITAPTGYEVSYENNKGISSGTITITNTLKTVNITVNKVWKPDTLPEGVTNPSSVTVKLQSRSNESDDWSDVSGKTLTLNSSSWTGTFEKLPAGKYYRVVETNIPTGWTATYSTDGKKFDDSGAITVTNTLSLASLNIKKYWDDDNNTSSRPSQIKVNLYRTKTSSSSSSNNSGSGSSNPITPTPTNDVKSDYSRLLQYSLYFYDANMCGSDVEESSDLSWRKDCHTYADDVLGGYHDAGDHVMFGLPQGYTASTLGWSYYENKAIYDGLEQTEHYQKIMK